MMCDAIMCCCYFYVVIALWQAWKPPMTQAGYLENACEAKKNIVAMEEMGMPVVGKSSQTRQYQCPRRRRHDGVLSASAAW